SDSPAVAIRHVLLFGASNLVLGWPALTRQLQQHIAQPVHIHTCLGMGRSYIRPSRCLARVLPGVLESRLWQNLPRPAAAPPLVLLTDVGNDIIYRFSVTDIQQAVAETIRRIRAWDARADIVLTGLPVQALDDLTPFRFQIARRLLFQGSPLTLPEAQQQAHELQQLLGQLATAPRSELAAIFATAICRLLERTKAASPNVLASVLGNWPARLTCGCLLRHCDDSEP
ncbi:MAG: hypothetical protein ACKPHU_27600, partial [Planctomycetaceae bacterium]